MKFHAKLFLAAALLWASIAAPQAIAQDDFCLLMFSSQRMPRNPNYSHSFAAFVRTKCCPTSQSIAEVHVISWLPANGKVRLLAHPECGRNFELIETIQLSLCTRQRVSLWGPYRICPELFERALNRIADLENGRILYKADDSFRRDDRVSNCIHAISALAQGNRLRVASPSWGDSASSFILERLMPWVVNREETHDWIAIALGLDAFPIAYRTTSPRPLVPPVTGLTLVINDGCPTPTYGPPAIRGRRGR